MHNLAYKLAAVHKSWGGDPLLDTYESERRQVALVNSQQSVKNGKKIFGLLRTLGTTDPDVNVARENLQRRLNDNDPEVRKIIAKGIESQREHFDNLGLHIGYVYGDRTVPENASVFNAVVIPGARLPHAWLAMNIPSSLTLPSPIDSSYVTELSREQNERMRFSTLDLIHIEAFTLIVSYQDSMIWSTRLEKVKKLLPYALKIQMVVYGVDFKIVQEGCKWVELMKLHEGQATLIRPDQHILTVFNSAADHEEIFKALRDHLAW